MIKIVDKYLIRSFVPPFVATFFIALFVLILQILWVYIDDIIGKGTSLFFIMEMIFYLSMALIPMALPIAVLISSVMVMGNMAEQYELSSLKSAGVSLARVMRPLMVLSLLIAVFSFVSSNYIIPVANLKGKTRMYDLRKQKPNLNLEAGVFNEDFEGYVIYTEGKSDDGRHINGVVLYPQSQSRMFQVITAEKGQLYTTPDQRYLVMELENGHQYQEMAADGGLNEDKPFMKTAFQKWQKLYDLGEFDLERTDEEAFRNNVSVLTLPQIQEARDSLKSIRVERIKTFQKIAAPYLLARSEQDTTSGTPEFREAVNLRESIAQDISNTAGVSGDVYQGPDSLLAHTAPTFIESFPVEARDGLLARARTLARSAQGESANAGRMLTEFDKEAAKLELEFQLKFSVAMMCIIFLFIGAPMGAIVRKGGFGYPLLIAICFFMLFMVLNMAFKSMAEKLIISPVLGAWAPCIILFPIGVWLTYRAMTDAKVMNLDRIIGPLQIMVSRIQKRSGGANKEV